MEFRENIDKESYKKFAERTDKSHFLQSYEWGQFCQKAKKQIAEYVGLFDDNNNLVATCLIVLKKTPLGFSYGYAPRGFLLDYSDYSLIRKFTEYLREYMKKKKIIYIKFDPDIKYQDIDEDGKKIESDNNNYKLYKYLLSLGYKHTGFYKLYEGNQPRYTFRINLHDTWDNIEKKMSKSFLKSVSRSEYYELEIDNENKVEEFYNLMRENSKKDGFDAHTLSYYEIFNEENKDNLKYFNISINVDKLMKKLKKEKKEKEEELKLAKKRKEDIQNKLNKINKDIEVFGKCHEDKILVCSLICIYTHNRCWSLFIGSDNYANNSFAISRAYMEAIKDAYARKLDFFDLFGTTGDPHTTYKNLAKLHDFKRKFGDEYIEFIGEFDLVNKPLLYKALPVMLKVYRKIRG